MREWSKLPENQQTWTAWKTKFREAYVAKRHTKAANEGGDKPFGGAVTDAEDDYLLCKLAASLVPSPTVKSDA